MLNPEYVIRINGETTHCCLYIAKNGNNWAQAMQLTLSSGQQIGVAFRCEGDYPLWKTAAKSAAEDALLNATSISNKMEAQRLKTAIKDFLKFLPQTELSDLKQISENEKEPNEMAKTTKKPTETPTPDDKIYFHQFKSGASIPVCLQKPLTDHGKKMLSDEIDSGSVFEIIDADKFLALRSDETKNLEQPKAEKHAEVCKLIDYEPMIKRIIACSEYFEESFTIPEIQQLHMEFVEATGKKNNFEVELKSHTQYLKAKITEAESTITRISTELSRGKRSSSVRCHWAFNDPTRNTKSLYRLDKEPKELVRTDRMTASDKQLTLDEIAAAKQRTERTLEEKEITPITNQPYEGEMMTDKEVETEGGSVAEVEQNANADAEALAEAWNETEAATETEDCPI